MDALVVCDGWSSHAQARVGAAGSSSCPLAASLPIPHYRLPIITAPEQKLHQSLKELEKSLAMQVRLKPESGSNFIGTSIYSMNFPLDSVDSPFVPCFALKVYYSFELMIYDHGIKEIAPYLIKYGYDVRTHHYAVVFQVASKTNPEGTGSMRW
ncbi:hypothetical protein VPH35_104455 [Triticum aestivum]